jgi:hypothetical protein
MDITGGRKKMEKLLGKLMRDSRYVHIYFIQPKIKTLGIVAVTTLI